MRKTFIYGLICPFSQELRYIGKANNPTRRVKDHMYDSRGHDLNKALWFRKMRHHNVKPILEIIEEVIMDEWQQAEEFWISYYTYIGANLLNTRAGGNGTSEANNTTFKRKVV